MSRKFNKSYFDDGEGYQKPASRKRKAKQNHRRNTKRNLKDFSNDKIHTDDEWYDKYDNLLGDTDEEKW
tara:strand:- start:319 stop:525 length:207 start_codon:yes stop_codon:yes gene_type:complete